jgi:hypothetical protein
MATSQAICTISATAGSAVTVYRFVAIAADGKYDHVGVAQARADGICAETVAADGDVFPMVIPNSCIAKVTAAATLTAGDFVASDNVGRAIAAVSTIGNFTLGVVRAGGVSGDVIEIQFMVDRDQA